MGHYQAFSVIDNFSNRIAESIKSLDVRAATYQDAARFESRLNKYVGELGEYEGGSLQDTEVKLSEINGRRLHLVFPKGSMSNMQRDVLDAVRIKAKTMYRYPVEIIDSEL
jgi:hypothetical protein